MCTILRLRAPEPGHLWRALRAWSEINDVCENESFDGHRKCIVEHTFHLLLLPGIHQDEPHSRQPSDPTSSNHSPLSVYRAPPGVAPCVTIPGTSLQLPSPFHFKMHIMTRLAFNEQGRITHHRDFWDIKDVMGLVPGVSLMQWVGSRVMARGLSFAYHSLFNVLSPVPEQDVESAPHTLTPAASYSATVKNALGLEGI
ncbi:hypothetical protein EYR36_006600 [Pleurotus pulmonarius]|nr:hypothetical protein EYR36_006600 [Pleurotus pulmonarius]KAF4601297.1 hypothetical protein EYR38_005949 [Pleurotus pulmonarius]